MADDVMFPEIQDPLSVNERFAAICDILEGELRSRHFVQTMKPSGRCYWQKNVGVFALRVMFDLVSERGRIHVDEMLPYNYVGASSVFNSIYSTSQLSRVLRFVDAY